MHQIRLSHGQCFRSPQEASVLATHVAAGFDLAADRAYGLARNVRISDSGWAGAGHGVFPEEHYIERF